MKSPTSLAVRVFLVLSAGLFLGSCAGPKKTDTPYVSQVNHPQWSKNANIYEVNLRQYTPEGTFSAFSQHLDRLEEMGVDILWFMPITPIGELNRKGSLGSYYSVRDYTAVNPEFGTLADFKHLVGEIHARGMYVIIDWVANHTAWDHPWTHSHPQYYTLDESGNFTPPVDDWSDVIDLNYDHPELWDAMIEEMLFWVRETNIDGFRCDVADMVPTAFWDLARAELEAIKPVFMLAEAENPALHEQAFEAGYGWSFHHLMNRVAQGEETVAAIDRYFFGDDSGEAKPQAGIFPKGAYKMYFITNHDENSWAGTEFMRMGEGVEAFAVLTASIPGMPLIYSGQEAAFNRMLEFFEKDEIDWGDLQYHDFYKTLLHLKNRNRALWNGLAGGDMKRINTSHDEQVFAFTREKDNDKVLVILNLSAEMLGVNFLNEDYEGTYQDLFSAQTMVIDASTTLAMKPWSYFVLEK